MKTVLITGGNKGIGAAMSKLFAASGYKVIINARTVSDATMELIEEIKLNKGIVELAQFDVRDGRASREYISKIQQLDVLVNNAGILRDNLVPQISRDDWKEILDTNFNAAVALLNLCRPLLTDSKQGCLINIASISGVRPRAGQGAYAVSKRMLIKWTEELAKSEPEFTSYAISPGPVATEMIKSAPWYTDPKAFDRIPLRRLATREEIAQAALFLANEQLPRSGSNMIVDGGFTQTTASQ